ncbi:MAG: FUSC family protein [Brachybacterium sp.]|nr:FUSC family protein [Brachybacterium sp.]
MSDRGLVTEPSRLDRVTNAIRDRLSSGLERTGSGSVSVMRAAGAAALAYGTSQLLWGHEYPFFSAIAAYVIIGFGVEKKLRKVFEMAAGVLLGVAIGEIARVTIGGGVWQIFLVVFVAAMLARFIDSGVLFAIQTGIQSLLVMIMPSTPTMQPGSRIIDAVTGVTIAIAVYLIFSGDPRRVQRRAAERFFRELEESLVNQALAARTGAVDVALAALKQIRSTSQQLTDEWEVANDAADELATFSPTGARHGKSVRRLQRLLVGSDRAMRNLRVIARTETDFLRAVNGAPHARMADALVAGQEAVSAIRLGMSSDVDFTEARRKLRLFCSYLTPEMLLTSDQGVRPGRAGHFEGITMVIQLRSLAIDLLQATGLEYEDALRFLPSLLIASDGEVIGPRPVTREMQAIEPPATTEALEILITDRSDPNRSR